MWVRTRFLTGSRELFYPVCNMENLLPILLNSAIDFYLVTTVNIDEHDEKELLWIGRCTTNVVTEPSSWCLSVCFSLFSIFSGWFQISRHGDTKPRKNGGFLSHGATPSHHPVVTDDQTIVFFNKKMVTLEPRWSETTIKYGGFAKWGYPYINLI